MSNKTFFVLISRKTANFIHTTQTFAFVIINHRPDQPNQ